jgi:hypothetical protein
MQEVWSPICIVRIVEMILADYHTKHVIPMQDALVCVDMDCNTIIEGPANECPRCTNKALMTLAVWLDEPRLDRTEEKHER